jgi:DNA polymerase III epsilon subunit-like protein
MIYDEIMLDLETLSIRPNAAIVSIGAVRFSWKEGIRDAFSVNISAESNKDYKLRIDKDAIEWWAKQPKAAREVWQQDPKPLPEALQMFNDWYGNSNHPLWSCGTNFDIPLLEEAYIRTGLQKPWKYYLVNDYRTVITLFGLNNRELRKNDEMYHSAVHDAVAQAEILIELLKDYKNGTTV